MKLVTYAEAEKQLSSQKTIKIGLPKGRFLERSLAIIDALGGEVSSSRALQVNVRSRDFKIYLLKSPDIANLVDSGMLDFGITSEEWYLEHCILAKSGSHLCLEAKLDWIDTSLAFFSCGSRNFESVGKVRVATSFPKIAEKILRENDIDNPHVFHVYGSVEALVPDIANVGFDCVETGGTLRANNLTPFYSPFTNLGMVAVSNQQRRANVPLQLVDLVSKI